MARYIRPNMPANRYRRLRKLATSLGWERLGRLLDLWMDCTNAQPDHFRKR
jgi:hypothetical protein